MMLLTPNWSMKLIISFCAPAVIESMATTAPTPKIMPSMVSKLRSLCANRLAIPINNSGPILESPMAICPRPFRPWRRRPRTFSRHSSCLRSSRPWPPRPRRRSCRAWSASCAVYARTGWPSPSIIQDRYWKVPWLFAPAHSAHGAGARGLFLAILLVGGRVGHGHDLTRRHAASDHHHGFALLDQLHRPRRELAVLAMHVNQKLAVLLKYGLRRNVNHVGQLFHLNLDIGQQARTKQQLHLRILLGRQGQLGILPVLFGIPSHVDAAAQHRRDQIIAGHVGVAAAWAAEAPAARALAPAAAGSVAAASLPASLARGDTRLGDEVGYLFLEFLALCRSSRLHLLAQIGHLFAVFIGHVAEAAASAATLGIRATLTAALRIGAHPAATATAAASAATAAGIVCRALRRRRREGIDAGVDPLLGVGFRRGHNALDVGGLHAHAGQQLPHIHRKNHIELLGRIAAEYIRCRRAAHGLDLAAKTLIGNGIELQSTRLNSS